MILRPYQQAAYDAVIKSFADTPTALIVMPTGTGKTIVLAHLCKHFLPKRCLILAHREELIYQARNKIRRVCDIDPDIEMASNWAAETSHFRGPSPIVVSSIQTQVSGSEQQKRMHRFNPHEFGLVVVDEAHHVAAKTYLNTLAHYQQNPNLKVLGVTATPDRADTKALGRVFKACPYIYGIEDAIDDGWLTPIDQQYVVCRDLDFSKISTTAGDLNQGELGRELQTERALHEMVSPTIEIVGNRKTLFFAVNVEQAERTCEIFNRHREGMAACVFGKTDKDIRARVLADFSTGKTQVLVNVGVATEGYDEPSIEVVAVGRPTKSRSLYCQMVGRGTRTSGASVDTCEDADTRKLAISQSHKPRLLVLDFVGNAGRHKLISTADVLGGRYCDDDIELATKRAQKSDKPVDMRAEIDLARREREEREARLAAHKRKGIVAKATYTASFVSAFEFDARGCVKNKPRHWFFRPRTEGQAAILRKRGIDPDGMTVSQASDEISKIAAREHWRNRPGRAAQ